MLVEPITKHDEVEKKKKKKDEVFFIVWKTSVASDWD